MEPLNRCERGLRRGAPCSTTPRFARMRISSDLQKGEGLCFVPLNLRNKHSNNNLYRTPFVTHK